jgi:site-specific recombinase XerD
MILFGSFLYYYWSFSEVRGKPMHRTLEQIIEHVAEAYSPNTLRAYRADFEEFSEFCHQINEAALPATPDILAAFIEQVTMSGQSSASIRRKLVSIAAIHRFSRYPDPTKDGEVKLAVRKMHRKLGRLCHQAYGITSATLDRMLAATSNDLRGLRDRVLLLLAYETMRRRSELVSLRAEDMKETTAGAVILLRKSKTDQESRGTMLYISQPTYRLVREWLKAARIDHGPILRGVTAIKGTSRSLGGGQIGRIYKRLAKSASLENDLIPQISGHSLRVGRAQDLVRDGATLPQIMIRGGWTKVDTVMRYIENTLFESMEGFTAQNACPINNRLLAGIWGQAGG